MRSVPELHEPRLYDLLEAAGEQARASVRLLAQGLEEGNLDPRTFLEPARTSATVAEEIRAHLLRADLVSLPKAEIEALISVLAAIPSDAARFAERFGLSPDKVGGFDLRPPLTWIEELSEVVLDMVRQLRGFESLDRLKELYARLQKLADQAETLADEIVSQVYRHPATTMHIMVVKDLSDQMGIIIDHYRQAGGIMTKISFGFF